MAALDEYRSESERLAKVATEKTSSATVLPDKIRNIINTKLEGNRDIIEQQRAAQADYFGSGDVAREKYRDVWDPRKKEALVNQYRTQQYGTYAALSDVRGKREGTISDIVGEAGRAGTAEAQAAQGAAQVARQVYQDMLQEYQWNEQMNLQRQQFAQTQSRANEPEKLSMTDVINMRNNGVPEEVISQVKTSEDAINAMAQYGTVPEGEREDLTKQEIINYAPTLMEQLESQRQSGNLQSEADTIRDINKLIGIDPYQTDSKDRPIWGTYTDILDDYYPAEKNLWGKGVDWAKKKRSESAIGKLFGF